MAKENRKAMTIMVKRIGSKGILLLLLFGSSFDVVYDSALEI